MEIRKIKNVTIETIDGYKCDCCKKISEGPGFPDSWHHFSSHHDDWGNDSIDSFEYYHVCSVECYIEILKRIVDDDLEDCEQAEVDGFQIQFARILLNYFKKVEKSKGNC